MKIPHPHSPGLSAFLVDSEKTPAKIERGPGDPTSSDGGIQIKYYSHKLHNPSIAAVNKKLLVRT
jgi:hypothetical protein